MKPERPLAPEVNADAAPEKLTSRDQWICWRFNWDEGREEWTKVPVKPFGSGGFASSTDSDTWRAFDEALDFHRAGGADTDGIGFVFSAEGMIAGVDFDDVREPAETPGDHPDVEAWAAETIGQLDSFTEVSPSGTGYHTYVAAAVPEGGNKTIVDEELWELEGESEIEIYDSARFFTFTGQLAHGSPDGVSERNSTLKDVHERFFDTGGEPDEATQSADAADVDLDLGDTEMLDKARASKTGDKFEALYDRGSTSHHGGDHSEADIALCQILAFWTGGDRTQMDRLFRRSGLMRDKWDEDRGAQTYGDRTIDKALSRQSEFYDPNPGAGAGDDETAVDDPEAEDGERSLPVPSAFSVASGRYGVWKESKDDSAYFEEWTNFQIELDAIVEDPDADEKLLKLTIHPVHEDAYDVEVEPTVLNEARSFKKEVCIGHTTTFTGGQRDLASIKQFVGSQGAPIKTGTGFVGYHTTDDGTSVWVTPNGTLSADGWIDEADLVFLGQGVEAERKWRLDPEDGADYDSDEVAEMLKLLPQARKNQRMIPLLGWYYASALRPVIFGETGQFNLMSVTGETGAGKTRTLRAMWEMFGMSSDPFSADSSHFSLLTTLSSTNSLPMWFDEYKPSDMDSGTVDQFLNEARKVTSGGVSIRGNADKTDDGYRLHAPLLVSGEERIHGSAEERRGIFTSFKKAPTQEGSETAISYAKLTGGSEVVDGETKHFEGFDFDEHALAYYQWLLHYDRDEVLDLWHECGSYVLDLLETLEVSGLEDLVKQGLQTIKFGAELYRVFAIDMGVDVDALDEILPQADIDRAIEYVVGGNVGGINRKSHLDSLLDVATRAAGEGYLEEDTHYSFVHKGKENEEIRLNLARSFDQIRRYSNDFDVSEDLLNSKDDYDARIRDESDTVPWLLGKRRTGTVGMAIRIHTETSQANIQDFATWMWDESSTGASEETWQSLDTHIKGRINATVEVVDVERDDDLPMAERGTLADASKAVDYVVWERAADNIEPLEEGKHYAIRGAKMDKYEGEPQIVLDNGVHEIREVEPGFGNTTNADPGVNATIDEAGRKASADGGEVEQTSALLRDVVADEEPCTTAHVLGVAVERGIDVDLEATEDTLNRMKEAGRVHDYGDGWETV